MTCGEVQDLAAELALGSVSGAERAAALAHLARCDDCRGLVDDLARAADNLLLLAPSAEPPPGFESRVLSRIAGAAQPVALRPRRRRRVAWLAAAAAVVAAASLSAVGVTELRHGSNGTTTLAAPPAPAGVRTALVRDDGGRWTCRAVVYGDRPTWLVVSLDRNDGLNAAFSVEALPAGGTDADVVPLGTFTISDGHGSLATMVGLQAQQFHTIRVLDSGGHVRYEMTFPEQA